MLCIVDIINDFFYSLIDFARHSVFINYYERANQKKIFNENDRKSFNFARKNLRDHVINFVKIIIVINFMIENLII